MASLMRNTLNEEPDARTACIKEDVTVETKYYQSRDSASQRNNKPIESSYSEQCTKVPGSGTFDTYTTWSHLSVTWAEAQEPQ